MMSRIAALTTLALLFVGCDHPAAPPTTLPAPATAPAGATAVSLPLDASDFIADPRTGAVFAYDPMNDTAVLLRPSFFDGESSAVAGPVTLGRMPIAAAFKAVEDKAYFVAICHDNQIVHVLSAEDLTSVGTVRLTHPRPFDVAASSDRDDPYIFCLHVQDSYTFVSVVDLRAMSEVGVLQFYEPNPA